VDYGPLQGLIGEWFGDKGMDVAPDSPDGTDGGEAEHNPFYETILFEPIGDVTNAQSQVIAALRYHQVVTRQSDGEVFHNESGYWMWDAGRRLIMQNLTIPRGVALVAGGVAGGAGSDGVVGGDAKDEFSVRAALGDADWPIAQSPFMRDHASTVEFTHRMVVSGDTLFYSEHMLVDIYGERFDHHDENTLQRR
jgi:hypothetical protein